MPLFAAPVLDYFSDLAEAQIRAQHGVISVTGSESDGLSRRSIQSWQGASANSISSTMPLLP
jgi:hypothetical protein